MDFVSKWYVWDFLLPHTRSLDIPIDVVIVHSGLHTSEYVDIHADCINSIPKTSSRYAPRRYYVSGRDLFSDLRWEEAFVILKILFPLLFWIMSWIIVWSSSSMIVHAVVYDVRPLQTCIPKTCKIQNLDTPILNCSLYTYCGSFPINNCFWPFTK